MYYKDVHWFLKISKQSYNNDCVIMFCLTENLANTRVLSNFHNTQGINCTTITLYLLCKASLGYKSRQKNHTYIHRILKGYWSLYNIIYIYMHVKIQNRSISPRFFSWTVFVYCSSLQWDSNSHRWYTVNLILLYILTIFAYRRTIYNVAHCHHDGCHLWSRNCLPFRSTWVHPGFLVAFLLLYLYSFLCGVL
jgi:hypothetical protein